MASTYRQLPVNIWLLAAGHWLSQLEEIKKFKQILNFRIGKLSQYQIIPVSIQLS